MSGSRPADSENPTDHFPIGCWFVPLMFIVMIGVGGGWWSTQPSLNSSAFSDYDFVFHDNLANNIGKGLTLNFADDEWIDKTIRINNDGRYNWLYSYEAEGLTAAHFPGIPYLMAAGEFVSGDRELFIVSFAGTLLALVLALLVNQVRLQFGWPVAFASTMFLIADGVIFQSSRFLSGDSLTAGLIALAFVAFVHGIDSVNRSRRSIWTWPFSGALFGATTLFQPQTSYWLLFLFPVWLGYMGYVRIRRKTGGIPIEAFVLFWIGVVLVAAPWWVRNCKVTGEFKPLGHAVGMNLVGAYCDKALDAGGNISVETILKQRELEMVAGDFSDQELVDRESFLSKFGKSTAAQWARDNSAAMPGLVFGRVTNLFGLSKHQAPKLIAFNAVVLLGALIGCWLSWRRWGAIIFLLVFVSFLVTAATWSDFGRQLIPLRSLIDVACAIGVVRLVGVFRRPEANESVQPN